MNKTVAIVLTYNRRELLKENIEALYQQTCADFDILVIDNNSTDNTYEYICEYENRNNFKYINTGENLGGAGGFSFGIKEAILLGYEYLWIMDDDTIPNNNALEEFWKADKTLIGNYGYLCSQVLWTDGSICLMNRQTIAPDWCEESLHLENGILKVLKGSFVSAFIKRDAILKMGLPIKEFFIWYDDEEFLTRIAKKYACYLIARSKVVHKMKSNINVDIALDSNERMDRYKIAYRNRYYIARRDGLRKKCGFYLYIFRTLKKIWTNSTNGKMKKTSIVLKSTISGWFFKPTIEHIETRI